MNRHERETYEDWLDRNTDPPGDCPVCDGGNGKACSEECDRAMAKQALRERLRRLKAQTEVALALVRVYRAEEGIGGARERAALDAVADCRIKMRLARAMIRLHVREAS